MNGWSLEGLPAERRCAVCGKRFCARNEYAYTRGKNERKRFFCSWHCLREFDRMGNFTRGKRPNENKDEIIRLLREGRRTGEIARAVGVSTSIVSYYKKHY